MLPRALTDIFKMCHDNMMVDAASSHSTNISVSFIEVYTEKVFDLLSDNHKVQINVKGNNRNSFILYVACRIGTNDFVKNFRSKNYWCDHATRSYDGRCSKITCRRQ